MVAFGFIKIDSSRRKMFSLVAIYTKNNFTKSVFVTFARSGQETRQPRLNCWPLKMKEQRAMTPHDRMKNVDIVLLFF